MKEHIQKIFKTITDVYSEEDVHNDVDNMKGDYVYDWEDEFESIEEAYEEQGRGESECAVLRGIIKDYASDLVLDDYNELFTALADHYCLNTN